MSNSHHPAPQVLAAGVLTAALALGPDLPAVAAPSGGQQPGMAASFVAQINAERAANHRSRLAVTGPLTALASSWAATMARTGTLAHNPHLSTALSNWSVIGENVGVGYSVPTLESAFWSSAAHRANMLDRDYTQIGVGVVSDGEKLWVTEDFSRPAHGSSSSTKLHRRSAGHRRSPVAHPAGRRATQAPTRRPAHPPAPTTGPIPRRWSPAELAVLAQAERLFAMRHELRSGNLNPQTLRDLRT